MRGVRKRRSSIRISNGAVVCAPMCAYNASETCGRLLLDRVGYKYCLQIPRVFFNNFSAQASLSSAHFHVINKNLIEMIHCANLNIFSTYYCSMKKTNLIYNLRIKIVFQIYCQC